MSIVVDSSEWRNVNDNPQNAAGTPITLPSNTETAYLREMNNNSKALARRLASNRIIVIGKALLHVIIVIAGVCCTIAWRNTPSEAAGRIVVSFLAPSPHYTSLSVFVCRSFPESHRAAGARALNFAIPYA